MLIRLQLHDFRERASIHRRVCDFINRVRNLLRRWCLLAAFSASLRDFLEALVGVLGQIRHGSLNNVVCVR
jgi:hypothetical protein